MKVLFLLMITIFVVNSWVFYYLMSQNKFVELRTKATKARSVLTKKNMGEIVVDLPRHRPFSYGARNSLTQDYFDHAYKTLNDKKIYLVFSNTGSAPSELISIFTNKEYNHVSLAFDRDLKTLVSFNGGESILPPGLNHEQLEFFNKKADASAVIYSLKVTKKQKQMIIQKIEQINEEGSSYNLVGLVVPYSHKPNIMYCSQFVYTMLKHADINYFNKNVSGVKPTDFIEQDKEEKLSFIKEIKFNTIQ